MSKSQYKNVFYKNPVIGVDLLNRLLRCEISPRQAVKIFDDNGIKAKERNIQVIIKNMRDKVQSKTTPNIITTQQQPKTPNGQITQIRREYESMDHSKIPDIDPIKLLDKHIYDLENLLLDYQTDVVVQKNIIELEMKIADKIFKMRPSSTEFNVNEVLRKNDVSTEFIFMFDHKYPNLEIKKAWLQFIKTKNID